MSAINSVRQEFCLPKRLWDKIVQPIAYAKNSTISQSVNDITQYQRVNKSILSFDHLRVFGFW